MGHNPGKPGFEELWRTIAPHVHAAIARHRSRDLALAADDLLQEVRIRVWQVYEGDRKSRFRASYYYRVVNSAIVDCLRRHRGTLAHATRAEDDEELAAVERLDAAEPGPEAQLDKAWRRDRLEAALARLPAGRARAVALFLQGFTVPEIAELLGCDRNRAHNLTYRGVRALKELMSEKP